MAQKYKNKGYKNSFENVEPKKQSPWMAITLCALLLVAIILGIVFAKSYFGVMHFTSNAPGETVYNPRTGVTYMLAPMCYQPVTLITKAPYGVYDGINYYALQDADPKDVLTTDEDSIYDIYYNVEKPLPTLSEFKVSGAYVCEVGMIAFAIDRMTTESAIKAAELVTTLEKCEQPMNIDQDSVLYLYFTSSEYKHLYYYITYFTTEDGERYLMDRSFGRCVNIGDELSDVFE